MLHMFKKKEKNMNMRRKEMENIENKYFLYIKQT